MYIYEFELYINAESTHSFFTQIPLYGVWNGVFANWTPLHYTIYANSCTASDDSRGISNSRYKWAVKTLHRIFSMLARWIPRMLTIYLWEPREKYETKVHRSHVHADALPVAIYHTVSDKTKDKLCGFPYIHFVFI